LKKSDLKSRKLNWIFLLFPARKLHLNANMGEGVEVIPYLSHKGGFVVSGGSVEHFVGL
jgi:hypothetical protein